MIVLYCRKLPGAQDLPVSKFEAALKTSCGLFPRNLIHVAHIDTLKVEQLQQAIVIYHGVWSGPSVVSIRLLFAVLARYSNPPAVYVLNADDHLTKLQSNRLRELFGTSVGAWGEIAWIDSGKVAARDVLAKMPQSDSVIEARLNELFRMSPPGNGCDSC